MTLTRAANNSDLTGILQKNHTTSNLCVVGNWMGDRPKKKTELRANMLLASLETFCGRLKLSLCYDILRIVDCFFNGLTIE
jgi:hypothetical protein